MTKAPRYELHLDDTPTWPTLDRSYFAAKSLFFDGGTPDGVRAAMKAVPDPDSKGNRERTRLSGRVHILREGDSPIVVDFHACHLLALSASETQAPAPPVLDAHGELVSLPPVFEIVHEGRSWLGRMIAASFRLAGPDSPPDLIIAWTFDGLATVTDPLAITRDEIGRALRSLYDALPRLGRPPGQRAYTKQLLEVRLPQAAAAIDRRTGQKGWGRSRQGWHKKLARELDVDRRTLERMVRDYGLKWPW